MSRPRQTLSEGREGAKIPISISADTLQPKQPWFHSFIISFQMCVGDFGTELAEDSAVCASNQS